MVYKCEVCCLGLVKLLFIICKWVFEVYEMYVKLISVLDIDVNLGFICFYIGLYVLFYCN